MNCVQKILRCISQAPSAWGEASHIEAMMESRRQVAQKMERLKNWEARYGEISKKHRPG